MKIHISVIGSTYDQFVLLDNALKKDNVLEVDLTHMSHRAVSSNVESAQADFYIYFIPVSASPYIHQKLDTIEKSICLFEEENQESTRLESLGFSTMYTPFDPPKIIKEIKVKLSSALKTNDATSTTQSEDKTLVFSSTDRYLMVDKVKLVRASSSGNYTTLYLEDEKQMTVTMQLGKVASKLPDRNFFRVHHGHVINRGYITSVLKQSQLLVVLRNHARIPVSRRRKKEFLTWLGLE